MKPMAVKFSRRFFVSLFGLIGSLFAFSAAAQAVKTAPATPLPPNFVAFGGPFSILSTLVTPDHGPDLQLSRNGGSLPFPRTDQIDYPHSGEMKLDRKQADKHPQ